MAAPINASSLSIGQIGKVVVLTAYAPDGIRKHYEVTGRLLSFRRTFSGEDVQMDVCIEGASEVSIPYSADSLYKIQVYQGKSA